MQFGPHVTIYKFVFFEPFEMSECIFYLKKRKRVPSGGLLEGMTPRALKTKYTGKVKPTPKPQTKGQTLSESPGLRLRLGVWLPSCVYLFLCLCFLFAFFLPMLWGSFFSLSPSFHPPALHFAVFSISAVAHIRRKADVEYFEYQQIFEEW